MCYKGVIGYFMVGVVCNCVERYIVSDFIECGVGDKEV